MVEVGTRNEATRVAWLETTLRGLPHGWRILDAGAGECQFRKFCDHLQYVSQDVSQYDGQGDGAGLQTGAWDFSRIDIVSDIVKIPEKDASFDAILCTEVFEHLPSPIDAVREFTRLLRPGGVLIITAPFASLTHFAPYHFYTGFNRYFYEKHLTENGFKINELVANGNFFEFVAQELRRYPEVIAKYSRGGSRPYERWAIQIVMAFLQRMSSRDRGSSELLNFGLHVRATKL